MYNMRNTWNQNQAKVKKTHTMQERTTTGCLMKLGIFLLKYFVHI